MDSDSEQCGVECLLDRCTYIPDLYMLKCRCTYVTVQFVQL